MDTFVITEKMYKQMMRSEAAEQFRKDIGNGKFDRLLFTYQRERAFERGIVVVRRKRGEEVPLFQFDCKPWEFLPEDGGPAVTRTDGITFAMLGDDKQIHNFTMATYEDYIRNGKTVTKGDSVSIGNSEGPVRIMLCFSHADEDVSHMKIPQYIAGAFALSVLCEIQREALRIPEKIDKARQPKEDKEKLQIKDDGKDKKMPARSVSLTNHIVYRYEPSDENVHREFVRRCECWTVRGHYRHCKSGKITFVKAHKKGKNRNAEPDKTYVLDM